MSHKVTKSKSYGVTECEFYNKNASIIFGWFYKRNTIQVN
jgi:hypothetical protein